MRLLLLLVVLRAVSANGMRISCESPYFDGLSAAENAAAGDVPWAASVSASSRVKLNNRCGATIISPRHLLTATHCFFDYASKTAPCSGLTREVSFGGTARLRPIAILRSFHDAACEGGNNPSILELRANIRSERGPIRLPTCKLRVLPLVG
ncbi:Peptidase S1 domain-containing protein [Aphelenchoides fujianensis]|nr:Peptidase S1 domain-containing protein [Aphelenchoides fujianensis]